ncbi:MAG: hypothetical protein HY248_03265, partial [Fimbriimonas ginsengisoli]|nr:hypothetical protein [Fimbriimonas ginsengisoli]
MLLVGILAVVRIFPGGFHVLATARNQALAQQLARQLLERVSAAPDGIPEQIVPVTYTPVSGAVRVDSAAYRIPGDTAPPGDGVDSKGMVLQNGTEVGYWPYVSGANILRRIVNEGHRVPAPRAVGSDFGGLLMLTFAPVLTDTDDYVSAIVYQPAFDVVGADMALLQGTPSGGVEREYQYYADKVSGPTATLYLPRATAPNGVSPRTYRVSFTAWVQKTVTLVVRREVAGTVTIDSDPAGGYVAAGESFTDTNHNGVWDTGEPFVDADGNGQYDAGIAANPSNLVQLAAGEVLDSLELDSIRVARQFAQVTSFTPGEPYEYKRINWKLGQLLFNPAGYNYYESRQEGRVPLVARVTYDVFDWRILHEDFRIPSSSPLQLRLSVPSLRPKNAVLPDSQLNGGLNVPLPTFDTTASTVVLENRDFALIDRETGGIFLPTSYNVDYTQGSITFVDNDANPANGLQMGVILP